MTKPRILVFASGSAEGGGSGFEKLVEASRGGSLSADIVAVVSNHPRGGVRLRADKLAVPFLHFPKPWNEEGYQNLARESRANFFALSGWLKKVAGLDLATRFNPRTVFNIHPGPLPDFGGPGMFGHHVHEAVMSAFRQGTITHSAVCMHFVTEEYDRGPIFCKRKVNIYSDDTSELLAARVNMFEHVYQPIATNLVVNGLLKWDGANRESLVTPPDYKIDGYA